jgi:FkbM family methyltransferase
MLKYISENFHQHSTETPWWEQNSEKYSNLFKEIYTNQIEDEFIKISLSEVGDLHFPFINMGNISSVDLFGLNELIIFSWYWKMRDRYKKSLDLGANIGLHSLIMEKLDFKTTSFEPDPITASTFKKIMEANKINNYELIEAAIGDFNGLSNFYRVTNNLTGSHLEGARDSLPYGGYDEIKVEVRSINDLLVNNYDFIKMDVEGSEADLVTSIDLNLLSSTDLMIEIGSTKNRDLIWNRLKETNFLMHSQKINWNKAQSCNDLPSSHKEGSLFISINPMNWVD